MGEFRYNWAMLNYKCFQCGQTAAASTRQPRCSCGGLWTLDFSAPRFELARVERGDWSLFRYRAFLPLEGEGWRAVSLGEGLTPIVPLDGDVLLKLEYCMPTLSFKDRGAAVLVAHCKAIGVEGVVQDSSGNAGNSVAAYCARAGIACEIFVPEGTSPKKIDMIRAHGAAVKIIPGTRDMCAAACRARVEQDGLYYASHVYNPFFYQGTKTYLYEVYEQLGRLPRHLFVPLGNGTLFLGIVQALEEFLAAGLIDAAPRVIAVQSERCDPLARAAAAGLAQPAPVSPSPTLAEGIAIGLPMRGAEILRAVRKYGMQVITAPEDEILAARARLARQGLYCEPTSAASYAAYLAYCRQHGPTPDALIPLTSAGLKSDH